MCDVHGHSRRFNVFFYGCCKRQSWALRDRSSNLDDYLTSRVHMHISICIFIYIYRRTAVDSTPVNSSDSRVQRIQNMRGFFSLSIGTILWVVIPSIKF